MRAMSDCLVYSPKWPCISAPKIVNDIGGSDRRQLDAGFSGFLVRVRGSKNAYEAIVTMTTLVVCTINKGICGTLRTHWSCFVLSIPRSMCIFDGMVSFIFSWFFFFSSRNVIACSTFTVNTIAELRIVVLFNMLQNRLFPVQLREQSSLFVLLCQAGRQNMHTEQMRRVRKKKDEFTAIPEWCCMTIPY